MSLSTTKRKLYLTDLALGRYTEGTNLYSIAAKTAPSGAFLLYNSCVRASVVQWIECSICDAGDVSSNLSARTTDGSRLRHIVVVSGSFYYLATWFGGIVSVN